MRLDNRAKKIKTYLRKVPFFKLENLLVIEDNRSYLRILLSRMSKSGEIIRLKRGMYIHNDYLTEVKIKGVLDDYYEFLACSIFEDAYLSLEYVLAEFGVLSENVYGYSLVTTKKTNKIVNDLASFKCHSIKNELFIGYKRIKKNNFVIKKASLAKALFDFLYFRKNILSDKRSVHSLRLRVSILNKKDKTEFRKYLKLAKSKKLNLISKYLDLC